MKLGQFWMVKGDGPTTYRHDSQASAEAEAQRLARLNPGQIFFVMEAVAAHRHIAVERISLRGRVDDEEIPF
ncbi:MAG: hypothetical protein AB7S99_04950 [Pseudodonghicola sp.]